MLHYLRLLNECVRVEVGDAHDNRLIGNSQKEEGLSAEFLVLVVRKEGDAVVVREVFFCFFGKFFAGGNGCFPSKKRQIIANWCSFFFLFDGCFLLSCLNYERRTFVDCILKGIILVSKIPLTSRNKLFSGQINFFSIIMNF